MESSKQQTYIKQLVAGKFENRITYILRCIMENPGIDTRKLREQTCIAHQSLTSCLTQLLDLGVIKIIDNITEEHEVYSKYEYVSDYQEVNKNRIERRVSKYQSWLKRGIKEFSDFLDHQTLQTLRNNITPSASSDEEEQEYKSEISEDGQVTMFK